MAGIKISALPAAPSAQLTDVAPFDQGATTFKVTNTQLLTLFAANANGTWGINISGNAATATSSTSATTATNATNIATVSVSVNANYFPLFAAASANSNQPINLGTGLTFNPSTNNLATTTFTGALVGNASTATSATSATSATTATTATNANNVATTAVNTNSSFFPLFVASSANGNQAADLGTGLTFNPSTNNLSTTTFTGALAGNATSATLAATVTTNANLTGSITSSGNTTSIGTGVVTNSNLATMADQTIKGNISGGVASPVDLSAAQVRTMIGATSGTVTSVATAGLATGGAITSAGTVTVTAATKTDQVTATSTSVAVVPGVQQNHPSACKAWAYCKISGTTLTTAAAYGVSISRSSAGVYVCTLATAMTSANYAICCSCETGGSAPFIQYIISSSTVFNIQVANITETVNVDPASFAFQVFGTQ